MHYNKDKFRAEGLVLGLLLGALVAAITSLLFAPKSGKEMRKDISVGTKDVLDNADDYFDSARKKGQEVVEDVSDKASSYFEVASDKANKATSKTKGMFNRKSKETEDKIHEVAENLGNKVDHLKK